jgi:tripeptidyl-peptidase-1
MAKLLCLTAVVAVVAASPRITLEGAITAPSSWTLEGPAAPEQTTSVYFFLTHPAGAEAKLEETLLSVSDPKSPSYGQHLNHDELRALMFDPAAAETLNSWLQSHNVTQVEPTIVGDMVKVGLTASQAEAMFHTKMQVYTRTHSSLTQKVIRATSYSVPEEIAAAVSVVGDIMHFPAEPRTPIVTSATSRKLLGGGGGGQGKWPNGCTGAKGSACKGLVEPSVLKTRYKLPAQPTPHGNNSIAVAEFQGQYYKPTDIATFSTGCAVSPAVTVAKNVGKNENSAGIESELDIEYAGAVSNPIPLAVWYQEEYSLLDWIKKVGSTADAALVHSVSYGNDEVQQTSKAYMQQVNAQLMQMGAKGISVLFASGDQGVWGRSGHGEKFHPDFPGGSPYVTAVGGTDFKTLDIGDETAWSSGGGGFSDTFARPSWQDAAVKAYLSDSSADLPPASYYNASGRGYPDVAALGGQKTPYCIASGLAGFTGVAGTSASCPVVAGVFALLNNERLTAGKSPLGFLNPFIYQNAAAFNDVTSGKNNAGLGNGFTAVKGWDAATGNGTPDYEKLVAAVKALP